PSTRCASLVDPAMSDEPRVHSEPPIPAATEFQSVPAVRSVICELDQGDFYRAALLIERMLWNPRLRGIVETRLNGLLATDVRWEPARNNKAARRAAAAMERDWPIL